MNTFDNDAFIINQSIVDGEIFSDQSELIPMNNTKYRLPTSENIKTMIYNSQYKGELPGYFYFNNETFVHPTNTSLLSLLLFDKSKGFHLSSSIQVGPDEIIDIVINNIDFAPHPFHLHGHHVWILAQGNKNDGYLNQTRLKTILHNKMNPIYRDTFTVNPYSYLVFRFKTDNPGLWMMHCHNDWHLQLGMALVFIESPEKIKYYYFNNNLTSHVPLQCQSHS
jgi:iron transport multicopper oxidase